MPRTCLHKYTAAFTAIAIIGLGGCDLAGNHLQIDRAGNNSVQDYRDALAPRPIENDDESSGTGGQSSADIPEFEPYVAQNVDNLRPMPIVSVSVNESVAVRDILYELAQQSGYGIELDPRINSSIIFTAKNKPLDVVMERIAEMAGLRYEIRNGSIKVRLDTPYTKSYKIDYLNIIRESEGAISTEVELAETAGGGGEGTETESSFSIESEGVSDFWSELESNITTILRTHARPDYMRRRSAGNAGQEQPELSGIGDSDSEDGPARLSVDSLQQQGGQGGDTDGGSGGDTLRYLPQFSVNKQAGMVNVHASSKIHKSLARYFKQLERNITSQVLIQAKVMEVELTDEFKAGIEWDTLNSLDDVSLRFNDGGVSFPGSTGTSAGFAANVAGNDFEALADALSRFGTVNTLASPRVTAVNNQAAVLNVAKNEIFFELDVEREESDTGNVGGNNNSFITVDSDIRSVPEGVLINVMPSIDLDRRQVSMRVRPTITEIVDFKEDPAVRTTLALADEDADVEGSEVPVVDVQEIDSVVNLDSGEAIVMGGLMRDRTDSKQTGVPVLSEVPGFGALFRKQSDKVEKTELVVLLRATILNRPSDSVLQADKELYREFSQDRRPFDL